MVAARNFKIRQIKNKIFLTTCFFMSLLGIFFLGYILMSIVGKGISALSWDVFFLDENIFGRTGLRFALIGQLEMTLLAVVIGVPLGLLAGIFLAEYGRGTKIQEVISMLADIMLSIPSIVIGIFVYLILVVPLGRYNGYAGAVSLAIIMFPLVLRTTENMMLLVPRALREAAFALGAPYYRVILDIVLKASLSGIVTGIILAIARVSGETAPLLFTSLSNNHLTWDFTKPMSSLTVTIYTYAQSFSPDLQELAWVGAFLITIFILFVNISVRLYISLRNRRHGD